jgi:hypothetical protein
MEDNTFYILSYTGFCLAFVLPFGYLLWKSSRTPRK